MKTEQEIKDKIKIFDDLRKEFANLGCIKEALSFVGKIELLEWVIESEATND